LLSILYKIKLNTFLNKNFTLEKELFIINIDFEDDIRERINKKLATCYGIKIKNKNP
jgi:hypothetical protein